MASGRGKDSGMAVVERWAKASCHAPILGHAHILLPWSILICDIPGQCIADPFIFKHMQKQLKSPDNKTMG